MRLVADEGVDLAIVSSLREEGHDVLYIIEFADGITDDIVLKYANEDDRILMTRDKDFGELPTTLAGNTSIMFSETGNGPAKVIKEFRKKSEKPVLKGAFVESAIFVGDENLETLVNIKSKEEVIGEIVTLLQSPAKNVVSALKSSGGKLAGILKTLSEK